MGMRIAILLLALFLPASAFGESFVMAFTATWCGPCQLDKPAIKKLIDEGHSIRFVDLDERKDLKERFSVKVVPCYVAVDPYPNVVGRHEGRITEEQLRKLCENPTASTIEAAVKRAVRSLFWPFVPLFSP